MSWSMQRLRGLLAPALAAVMVLLAGCASLPPPRDRVATVAVTETADTRLGRAVAPYVVAHPGVSGIHKFSQPHDAFAARVLLADAAQKSLDAQYFIWSHDQVGSLLFEALWKAAERGVRVRLLLDDANTSGLDATLAALDAHPNIELRLYNPFSYRGSRAVGYISEFGRLNRRMHNKSFTADNQLSVVGGRNIANEYFGAAGGIGFADIDVLAIGPVVREVSKEFDLYWNSASAYPAAPFVDTPGTDGRAALEAGFAARHVDPVAVDYLKAVEESSLIGEIGDRQLAFEWTTVKVLYDDPAKTLDPSERTDVLLFPELMRQLGTPEKSFDIVSPYFVPGAKGTSMLTDMARRGVKIRVLTNSLASSDVSIVHAGYMKRRRDLLLAGVALYELKPNANEYSLKVRGRFGAGKVAGLHAKTYAVDGERIFVGSFNFDLRSARLNTEMGLVIDSPVFARQLDTFFDEEVPDLAYEVRLAPQGEGLVWIERTASGEQKLHDVDPETDWAKRFRVGLMSDLPIDWLL